ncbi:hypothetical protein RchiOBHm_Chr1g0339721 [Rosa chinensis]|uniref:Uncharacterized protein n=1 Tax=Rosa chinensis TaxID=74649 RepID=A0A2P6SDA1_ROSCH|nr:hypothetical protein RchiOBHm_Chr1g0339721 [Rosa chinensis]
MDQHLCECSTLAACQDSTMLKQILSKFTSQAKICHYIPLGVILATIVLIWAVVSNEQLVGVLLQAN